VYESVDFVNQNTLNSHTSVCDFKHFSGGHIPPDLVNMGKKEGWGGKKRWGGRMGKGNGKGRI
jgi:hypothetical protein